MRAIISTASPSPCRRRSRRRCYEDRRCRRRCLTRGVLKLPACEGPGLYRDINGSPMINDPIVDELDRLRAEKMAEFNFDFEAFYRDLKAQEKLSPEPIQPPPETPSTPRGH